MKILKPPSDEETMEYLNTLKIPERLMEINKHNLNKDIFFPSDEEIKNYLVKLKPNKALEFCLIKYLLMTDYHLYMK